jgi:hypothetical protein
MVDSHPPDSPTVRIHKRQFIWQILIPFFVMLALIVAAAVLVVIGGVSQARLWADISIVWLLAPALLVAFAGIAVLAGMIYTIARLTKAIPRYTSRAQLVAARVNAGVRQFADGSTKPILWFQQAGVAITSLIKKTSRHPEN